MTVCDKCAFYYSRVAKDWNDPLPKECFTCGPPFPNFVSIERRCTSCSYGGSRRCKEKNHERFMNCSPTRMETLGTEGGEMRIRMLAMFVGVMGLVALCGCVEGTYVCKDCGWTGTLQECEQDVDITYMLMPVFGPDGEVIYMPRFIYHYHYYCPQCGGLVTEKEEQHDS